MTDDCSVTDSQTIAPALCIILAGGPRLSPLAAETGYSVLDLTATKDRTVLGVWIVRLSELCSNPHGYPTRIVHDASSPRPELRSDPGLLSLEVKQERLRYRGPIGIAHDEAQTLNPDDLILLVEAGRLPCVSLRPLLQSHSTNSADVTVAANPDSTTAGLFIFRKRTLEIVPKKGFMDLKEQWLIRGLEKGWNIHVHTLDEPGALTIRTPEQYLAAVRMLNEQSALSVPPGNDSHLSWLENPAGPSVVSTTATIARDAVLVDSVVMAEATVGSGCVLARTIVSPRTVVGQDQVIVDAVVGKSGVHSHSTGRIGGVSGERL